MSTNEDAGGQQVEARGEALRLLEERKYGDALQALKGAIPSDRTGKLHALSGLAHFHLEEYATAADYYEAALTLDSNNADVAAMLGLARANAVAEVDVFVPPVSYFDGKKLLAKATLPSGALPSPHAPLRPPRLLTRLRVILGKIDSLVKTRFEEVPAL